MFFVLIPFFSLSLWRGVVFRWLYFDSGAVAFATRGVMIVIFHGFSWCFVRFIGLVSFMHVFFVWRKCWAPNL
jgi:hypothetical protein